MKDKIILQILLYLLITAFLLCICRYINVRTEIAEYELHFIRDEWTAFTNYEPEDGE